jgi:CRISPR-associated endonuclease/helicase Cas3
VSPSTINVLLAKSRSSKDRILGGETLQGHTACVLAAADVLLAERGQASLDAAGLTGVRVERLVAVVRTAAFAHDLGKANDHFQLMVRGRRAEPQLVRHEALSLWLCWPGQPLGVWLRPAVESHTDYLLAVMAVAGHHRKFTKSAFAPEGCGAGVSLTLLLGHPDFAKVLTRGQKELNLGDPPSLKDEELTVTVRKHPRADFERWQREAEDLVRVGTEGAKLLAVAKALLLAADVAGSALWKAKEKPSWIGDQLRCRPGAAELEEIVTNKLGGQPLRPFQRAVAASDAPLTLVRAGCGTGKTAAAYQWAAERCVGRQVWVTYPTTGTATEGFRGYVRGLDGVRAMLEHGRAKVDFEILKLRGDDESATRDYDRLEAMRAWGAGVVTCTVDTVLGLVQNHRKGLYAWPGLSHAAVVFDEIHAYDDLLFGSLLRFLEALPGLPCLLMTASLPAHRLRAIEQLCRRVHGRELAVVDGPRELEALPRYRLVEADDPMALVREHVSGGGKVLWVSNTVDRCMAVAQGRPEVLVYHSRFRYVDRVRRHQAVIDAFGRAGQPAWASTTQVAEMSLDLSATLLVTDLAPVPAMIQRLGRLNRHSTPERPAPLGEFVVVPFGAQQPYPEKETMAAAQAWVDALRGRELSQRDLIDAWGQNVDEAVREAASSWLDRRFTTEPHELRESSPGLTVLLADDAPRVRRGEVEAVEVALPMPPPRGDAWKQWEVEKYHPVAPAGALTYDETRGGRWNG